MIQNKRTHISIKTKDVLIVRNGAPPPAIFCPSCGAQVEILTPEQARERGLHPQTEAEVIAYREEKEGEK